jgi:hypothetical protein
VLPKRRGKWYDQLVIQILPIIHQKNPNNLISHIFITLVATNKRKKILCHTVDLLVQHTPTIKKKLIELFRNKGNRPSVIVDLLPHHYQTTNSPYNCNQRQHHHPITKQQSTNTTPHSHFFSSPSPVTAHLLSCPPSSVLGRQTLTVVTTHNVGHH